MIRYLSLVLTTFCLSACKPPPDPTDEVDVAIVTVIAAEYEAMLHHVDRRVPLQPPPGITNSFGWVRAEIDRDDGADPLQIVVALAGEAGTTSGALAVAETARVWHPRVIVLAGIAGGFPPAVNRGDVLVSQAVWGYEYGAIAQQFAPRRDWMFQSHPELFRTASVHKTGWQQRLRIEKPDASGAPRLLTGATASGNKVIETMDSALVSAVMSALPNVASVEMEGAGALAAAELLAGQSSPPALIMFRGISDIPNPTSGLFGDKKDRELWKSYAADAVAAFTVDYLATALPSSLMGEPGTHPATDVLMVTCTASVLDALRSRLAASISEASALTLSVSLESPAHTQAYHLTVQQLLHCDQSNELLDAVQQYRPRYVMLADLALGLDKLQPGDVAIARLIWTYENTDDGIKPHHEASLRLARAVVNAAQSLGARTQSLAASHRVVHAGAFASGNPVPLPNDKALIDQILRENPRTLVVDPESGVFAAALKQHKAVHGWPGFVNVQAARAVAGEAGTDEAQAADNVAGLTLDLIRHAWPVAPLLPPP